MKGTHAKEEIPPAETLMNGGKIIAETEICAIRTNGPNTSITDKTHLSCAERDNPHRRTTSIMRRTDVIQHPEQLTLTDKTHLSCAEPTKFTSLLACT